MLLSCKHKRNDITSIQEKLNVLIDTFDISNDLKESSLNFIKSNHISNGNIEVDIDKKEHNQVYITFICRGMADFGVRKFKPLFSYKIESNIFFVFTGAEELLNISFDENKYLNREQSKCDNTLKWCYVFEDNKIRKEDTCSFENPFSSLRQSLLPLLK